MSRHITYSITIGATKKHGESVGWASEATRKMGETRTSTTFRGYSLENMDASFCTVLTTAARCANLQGMHHCFKRKARPPAPEGTKLDTTTPRTTIVGA